MEPTLAPSAMPASDPTRVTGRRFGAYLVDALVLGGIVPVLIFFAVSRPTIYTDGPSCEFLEVREIVSSGQTCIEGVGGGDLAEGTWVLSGSGWLAAALYLVVFLIAIEWILQGITGMTIGKILFGVRTVDESGTGPGIGKQLVRGLVWIIDAITILLPVAAWSILLTKRRQRLGDLAAGTFVVRSSARGVPVPAASTPAAAAAPPPGLQPSGTYAGTVATAPPTGAGAYPASPPFVAPAPSSDPTTVQPPATEPTVVQPAPTVPSDSDVTTAHTAPGATEAAATSTSAAATTSATGGPQWDPARNAYIQWDPARGSWLVYDDAASEWKPIG